MHLNTARRKALAVSITGALFVALLGVAPLAGRPPMVMAVPQPSNTQSVITVKVGGTRTALNTVAPLAGVTLQLYDGSGSTPGAIVGDDWATCVSDAQGDCWFLIPDTGPGGDNRDRRFWIIEAGVPSDWFGNDSFVTGSGAPFTNTPYQFRTGNTLRGGQIYSSSSALIGSGATTSSGVWQVSAANPDPVASCGITVAMILDLSLSVGADLPFLEEAAVTMIDALVGTKSSVALFTFSTNAPANNTNNQNRPLTPVSTQEGADTIAAWIDNLTLVEATNWDRGLYQVAQSAHNFDVAVIVTDGNPTRYGTPAQGVGQSTRFVELEHAVFSANAIKAKGTRVVAVGVGAGVSGDADNLIAISGPVEGLDYFQTEDYEEAGDALAEMALSGCDGTLSVIKMVVPWDAPDGSIAGATPAGGWTFSAEASGDTVVDPTSAVTDTGTGAVVFDLEFGQGTDDAIVTVTETQLPGYELVQVGGDNAICVEIGTQNEVEVTNAGELGFSVPVGSFVPVSCRVYNRAPSLDASFVVDKLWVINGVTYEQGEQPPGFSATFSIEDANGNIHSDLTWGHVYTGHVVGDTGTAFEEVLITHRQCVLVSQLLTIAHGEPVSENLPYEGELLPGLNEFQITNTVECDTRLTLTKLIGFGDTDPTAWTLTATAEGEDEPTLSGSTGSAEVTHVEVIPEVTYFLAESGGDPNFVQWNNGEPIDPAPGATYNWLCFEVDADGIPYAGFEGGFHGTIRIPIGTFVRCAAVNDTAFLTLVKIVEPDGAADPAEWQLTATPIDPVVPGLTAQTVQGSVEGVQIQVRPGQRYLVTESGPEGSTLIDLTCEIEEAPVTPVSTSAELVLEAGDHAVCTFVNAYDEVEPAQLELTKTSSLDGAPVAVGDTFDYILTVSNSGESEATDVVITDDVPEELEVVEVTVPEGWIDETVGNQVSVSIPTLGAGESGSITVTVEVLPAAVDAEGPIRNEACVIEGETEGEDCDSVEVTTEPPPSSTTTTTVSTTSSTTPLPTTGAESLRMALWALLLVGVGATVVWVGRSRRKA